MKTVSTTAAPAAIGPYSQAKIVGNLLFTAGQIPLVPETMEMVTGSIEAQTERVLQNLSAILKEASTSWDRVLKTTVFLTDMNDFAAMNEVYGRQFARPYPARTTIGVASLPLGARIEIEMIARAD